MRTVHILSYLFAALGIAMLAGAAYMTVQTRTFVDNSIETTGTVTELIEKESSDRGSFTYLPVVVFETASEETIEFRSRTSSNPPAFHVGETVRINYDPAFPSQARIHAISTLWLFPIMLVIMGLVFGGAGFGMILYTYKRKKLAARLRQTGVTVQATVSEVVQNTSVIVNGRSPYVVYAQYEESGQLYTYKSDNIWFDPSEYVEKSASVTVYVDPQNKSVHFMDLSFLPKHAM